MSMTTRAKTVLSRAIASLGLLILAAGPSVANTHTQTKASDTASSPANETKLAQEQRSQTAPQANPRVQQPTQMGCSCCQNMMNNNLKGMMNTPGMMGTPNQSR